MKIRFIRQEEYRVGKDSVVYLMDKVYEITTKGNFARKWLGYGHQEVEADYDGEVLEDPRLKLVGEVHGVGETVKDIKKALDGAEEGLDKENKKKLEEENNKKLEEDSSKKDDSKNDAGDDKDPSGQKLEDSGKEVDNKDASKADQKKPEDKKAKKDAKKSKAKTDAKKNK